MNLPHLPNLSRRHMSSRYARPSIRLPKFPVLWDFSLSTKLILLVIIPLALTLAVTLPLTMTGLNKLASVTSAERLEDEIILVDKHLNLSGSSLSAQLKRSQETKY